jgi:hypothetical protein
VPTRPARRVGQARARPAARVHHIYISAAEGIVGLHRSACIRPLDTGLAHLLTPAEARAASAAIQEGRQPSDAARTVPLTASAVAYLAEHPEDAIYLHDLTGPDGFLHWLDRWKFVAEGGAPQTLGETLWEGQAEFVDAIRDHDWLYVLKGRQVGLTTIACAFDGFVFRLTGPNSRVHLFSHAERESQELLEQVVFGLDNLPEWLRLPVKRQTTKLYEATAGPHDRRILIAYTAARTTSRGATCTHAHADEWSQMAFPRKTMASIEPSCAGSMHILTTAVAPEDDASDYYRRCIRAEGKHEPLFISSLARPDRDEDWYEGQRRSLPPSEFDREYPQSWQQALQAAGESFFSGADLECVGQYARGFSPWRKEGIYGIGVDVGYVRDASVFAVLEADEDGMLDVVSFTYLVGTNPVEVARKLTNLALAYPSAHLLIEDTGPGYALRQNIEPQVQRTGKIEGFATTAVSKSHILSQLQHSIAHQEVKYRPEECPELHHDLLATRADSKAHTPDATMALALAVEAVIRAQRNRTSAGRIIGVIQV